jgi:glycerol-3-phosphate dehydrogenase
MSLRLFIEYFALVVGVKYGWFMSRNTEKSLFERGLHSIKTVKAPQVRLQLSVLTSVVSGL